MERAFIASIEAEYRRYRALFEKTIDQLSDAELVATPVEGANSIACLGWHIAGNLRSRFTDFLSSDGEKPWRKRDEEFAARIVTRRELQEKMDSGWIPLFDTLAALGDRDLGHEIVIRRQSLSVAEALHRSLAHLGYHVGQVVLLARALRGEAWGFLSIPPGRSEQYNADPNLERGPR